MEYKRKLTKTKKAHKENSMKERGFKKIKVRGRKRWVNPVKANAEA